MEAWARTIVEWINCLEIAQPPVENVRELRNCVLYHKIVRQLCTTGEVLSNAITGDEQDLVSEFLRTEYPECMTGGECATELTDELYIASLLLIQCSQKAAFHRPMCANLKPDTQIAVKNFLEMVLPYGKTINREIVAIAATETSDGAPTAALLTPVERPLREFFNSPAARSARGPRFDRNRELRRLKAQLETERFEKADLAEDIRIQDEKIRNLQKKLEVKSQELKTLKNERANPPTPQSCRKNENRRSDNEERYRRESEQLELANLGLQTEIEKLRDEREELVRRLTSKDRLHSATKEKMDQYERTVEALSIQLEMKTNELLGLRMNNEELREHIREMQKSSLGELSFEMEPISRPRSPMSMNCSEALSSIVDIQLQEAKEESAQLRSQLDATNRRLDDALRECEDIRRSNAVLEVKAAEFDVVSSSLRDAEERLAEIAKNANVLELEKAEFIADRAKLEKSLALNVESLTAAKNRADALAAEIAEAKAANEVLAVCLQREKLRTGELESTVTRGEKEREDLQTRLASIEEKLIRVEDDKAVLESDAREKSEKLRRSENDLANVKSRVVELETIVADAKKRSEDLQILVENREANLSRSIEEGEKLKSELRETVEKLAESENHLKNEKSRIAELESTVTRGEKERDDLQTRLASIEEKLIRVEDDKAVLESDAREKSEKLCRSENDLANVKSRVVELETIVADAKKRSEDLQILVENREASLSRSVEEGEKFKSELRETVEKLAESENHLKNEKSRIAELESTVTRGEKEREDLQTRLASIEEKLIRVEDDKAILEIDAREKSEKLCRSENDLANVKSRVVELETIVADAKKRSEDLQTLVENREASLSRSVEDGEKLKSELRETVEKLAESENHLKNEKSRIAELESTVTRGEKEREDLQTRLASIEEKLIRVEDDKAVLEMDAREKSEKLCRSENDLANVKSRVVELETIVADAKKRSEDLQILVENREASLSRSVEEGEKLKSELRETVEKLAESENHLKNEKSRIAELESTLIRGREEYQDLQNSFRSNEETLSRLNDDKKILVSNLKDIKQQLEQSEIRLSDEKTASTELRSILSNSGKEFEKLKQQLSSTDDELSDVKKLNEILRSNIADHEKKLVQSEASLNNEKALVAELKSTIADLQKNIDDLQSEHRLVSQSLAAEKSRVADLEAALASGDKNAEDQQNIIRELEISFANEKSLTAELKEIVRLSENKCEDLESSLRSKEVVLEEIRESASSLNAELVNCRLRISEMETSLRSETLRSEELNSKVLQVEKNCASVEAELASNERILAQTEMSKINAETELNELNAEMRETKSHLSNLQNEIDELEKEKREIREANEKIEEYARKSDEKIISLEAEIADRDERLEEFNEKWAKEKQEAEVVRAVLTEKISTIDELSARLRETENREAALAAVVEEANEKIESLEKKIGELAESRSKLENELVAERDRLNELRNEKEIMEDELSLYGRSNEHLGNKIITLEKKIEDCAKDLEKEREANATLEKSTMEINAARNEVEKKLTEERERLSLIETENESLEKKLVAHERSKDEMKEKIRALLEELENSREEFQRLRSTNEKLRSELTDSGAKIESLKDYERRCERLAEDVETATKELETSRRTIEESSENIKIHVEEIARLKNQLNDVERENKLSVSNFEERIRTTDDIVESLRQRLVSAEKSCVESKLEEKLTNEAMEVLRTKLEQLSREKIESEVKLKEVIVNLQEVRSGQDEVLKAQAKKLEENVRRLEEAEKEIVESRNSLTAAIEKTEVEKSARRETEIRCEKLTEHNKLQSNLVEELKIALEIEHNEVVKSAEMCKILENAVNETTKTFEGLRSEFKEMWKSLMERCPEIGETVDIVEDHQPENDESDVGRLSRIVRSSVADAETIRRAVTILTRTNDKLNANMVEIVQVSESLKLELEALWDSVRRACPELARLKEKTLIRDDETADNSEISEISVAVKSFADDAKTIRKAVSILTEANETLKEHLDGEKATAKNTADEAEKRKLEMNDRIENLENERKKRDRYLALVVEKKKKLQETLSTAMSKRDNVDEQLGTLMERWKNVGENARSFIDSESSACDELKHLLIKQTEVDDALFAINERHGSTLKSLLKALCRIFVWSEEKLQEARKICVVGNDEARPENELSEEQEIVETEIRRNEETRRLLTAASEKIDDFTSMMNCYETSLKSGAIKRSTKTDEKLQSQLEKLSKEKKDLKEKLDAMRLRGARLEKNMDDLRNENKKLKLEASSVAVGDSAEVERLRTLSEKLGNEISRLQKEIDESSSKRVTDDGEAADRLKEVHNEYAQKVEKIKQRMKTAYNEQIAKLNREHEKALEEKMSGLKESMSALQVQMEKQCKKYTEDIEKYKAHISDLSSRYWDVGEKLLAETQEKQSALQKLDQLRGRREQQEAVAEINQQTSVTHSSRLKTASLDRRDMVADRATRDGRTRSGYRAVEVIEEETTTRRHSVKTIQAMGNAFNAEDEEGELFDSVYLTDLKEGRCVPAGPDFDRISELRMRNSMCRPHLKSSYAVETQYQPITLTEDDMKNGATGDDVFNDSLSQSLLPGQKPKKKDRTQTSYKRPGPPTPSKNGGRLSLQGNELKSPTSRVLRERNVERRTTATPRGLKNLFGTSMSKRQDENATGTPKGRRLSNIFRKQRTDRN